MEKGTILHPFYRERNRVPQTGHDPLKASGLLDNVSSLAWKGQDILEAERQRGGGCGNDSVTRMAAVAVGVTLTDRSLRCGLRLMAQPTLFHSILIQVHYYPPFTDKSVDKVCRG